MCKYILVRTSMFQYTRTYLWSLIVLPHNLVYNTVCLPGKILVKLQWTKPPEGDPAAAHAARAPAPPLPLGGGGSSLWQQKKWGAA